MAWLKGEEPAGARVQLLFEASNRRTSNLAMNVINLGEVLYLCAKAKNLAYGERVLAFLSAQITIVSASDELVMAAAKLKARYRLSYADAFAAVTAISQDAVLVTGDPEIKAVASKVNSLRLEWIGRANFGSPTS